MIVKSNTTIHEYTSKGGTLTSAWYPIPSTCTYVQVHDIQYRQHVHMSNQVHMSLGYRTLSQPSTYVTKLGYQTLSNTLPTKECWHTGGKYDHLRSQHSLPWRSCFAFGSLPTYLLVTKQCVNNIACVQQSDQSWSNTHHDWSDIVVTRCILEYYKQCVNHCLRLNTFCIHCHEGAVLPLAHCRPTFWSQSNVLITLLAFNNQISPGRQLIMTKVTSWQHDVYLDCQNRSRWIQWNR